MITFLGWHGRQLNQILLLSNPTTTSNLIAESNYSYTNNSMTNDNPISVNANTIYTLTVPSMPGSNDAPYIMVYGEDENYLVGDADELCTLDGDVWICSFTTSSSETYLNTLNFYHSDIGLFMSYYDFEDLNFTLYEVGEYTTTISYTYNDQGYRTSKTINETTIDYHLQGDKVLFETDGTYGIIFTYDFDGKIISFNYDSNKDEGPEGIEYYYIRNQQGDITKIVDKDGDIVVEYFYDAWGKLLNITDSTSDSIGTINPYRYRGYRYDEETALYYLNSRYYDENIGRFINSDGLLGSQGNILGHNMFAYTQNNPVMYTDGTGYEAEWYNPLSWNSGTKIAVAVGIILVLGIATVITGGAAAGAAGFIFAGAFQGAITGALIGGATGAIIGGTISGLSGDGFKNGAINGAADGIMMGAFFGGAGGAVNRLSILSKWNQGNSVSKFAAMKYHYETHSIQTGSQFLGNGMVKYTRDAYAFGQAYSSSAFWKTYESSLKQPGWMINNSTGKGLYDFSYRIIYFLNK